MVSPSNDVAASFAVASIFLGIGHVLRAKLSIFRRLFIPASLLGGLLALATISLTRLNPSVSTFFDERLSQGWDVLPSFLTNVVFACLLLGAPLPSLKKVVEVSGSQLCFGQMLAFGQYCVCALLTAAWFESRYEVPAVFACIVPIGFEGGHGVVGGMRETLDEDYPDGYDQGLVAATMGLLMGTATGWAIVNWAASRGRLQSNRTTASEDPQRPTVVEDRPDTDLGYGESVADNQPVVQADENWWSFNGVYPHEHRPVAAHQTVAVESLDTLALHISAIGVAVAMGWCMRTGLVEIEQSWDWLAEHNILASFPLFPFTLAAALLMQAILDCLGPTTVFALDRAMMERIGGTAMDFLVLVALAKLNFDSLSSALVPFFTSCAAIFVWSILALVIVGPYLEDLWLERATVEVALSMGATATALLVLRMVDPENKTILLKAFCFKQIAHVCIVGGGVFTSLSPTILRNGSAWIMFGISGILVVFWYLMIRLSSSRAKKRAKAQLRSIGVATEDQPNSPLLPTGPGSSVGGATFVR